MRCTNCGSEEFILHETTYEQFDVGSDGLVKREGNSSDVNETVECARCHAELEVPYVWEHRDGEDYLVPIEDN